MMTKGLDTVWRVGKLLLEGRLRLVVENVMRPLKAHTPGMVDSIQEFVLTGQVTETELDRKARALLLMGECWSQMAAEALHASAEEQEDHSGFAALKRQVDQAAAGEGSRR
eukprot:TRINITY_DN15117_c0_g1_i1.p1 TRINITY_DN15117_c0_g1~~TRINITY_DN15117_c0_g1_i1.p1  ORF type:complete len:111 (-),score=13.40 TRINITY_DN15117_c0_g1_i1:259-591(-)